MKKDAYYFPHFSNARHDRKLKRIIRDLGMEGYGIYFMLLEVLREQTDFRYPLVDLDLLASEFGADEEKIRKVITDYDLFETDDHRNFFSIKLIFYLQPYLEKTERARNAANVRWSKVAEMNPSDANAMQMQCTGNAPAMQGKESKGKESKGKESKGKDLKDSSEDGQSIIESYHRFCPSLPKVVKLTPPRQKAIKSALKEYGLALLEHAFSKAEQSDFLTGRRGDWSCGFDWIMKPANLVKILEGNYDNKQQAPTTKFGQSLDAISQWAKEREER